MVKSNQAHRDVLSNIVICARRHWWGRPTSAYKSTFPRVARLGSVADVGHCGSSV